MNEEPKLNYKHVNQTKVLLDDEYEGLLTFAAMIHRTKKSVLVREVLKSWLLSLVEDDKRDRRSTKANQ